MTSGGHCDHETHPNQEDLGLPLSSFHLSISLNKESVKKVLAPFITSSPASKSTFFFLDMMPIQSISKILFLSGNWKTNVDPVVEDGRGLTLMKKRTLRFQRYREQGHEDLHSFEVCEWIPCFSVTTILIQGANIQEHGWKSKLKAFTTIIQLLKAFR